jgi:hypothetical protein
VDPLLLDSLHRAGWLPHTPALPARSTPPTSDHLLPWIEECWRAPRQSRRQRAGNIARAEPMADWLAACVARGAALRYWRSPLGERAGQARLLWWPQPPPPRPYVGLLSSHLGRTVESQRSWFAALRAVCDDEGPAVVLAVAGRTTARPYLQRAAELWNRNLLVIQTPRAGRAGQLAQWLRAVRQSQLPPAHPNRWIAHVSPPFPAPTEERHEWSIDDELLYSLCDRTYLLTLRAKGRLRRLLASLSDPPGQRMSFYLATGPELISASDAEWLQRGGARVWRHFVSRSQSFAHYRPLVAKQRFPAAVPWREPVWPYLTHCTRYVAGPWPDQSHDEYLDDLLLDRPGADHSPLAALLRICAGQRLVGSAQAIRGGRPVVCFTAAPVGQLPELCAYRGHRQRRDFLPYALCIRRDWLEARGAQPVCYGDEQLWTTLADAARPLFQLEQSRPARRGDPRYDWRREQEWRVVGDLDLSPLDADSGLLLVPTAAEARIASLCSRWPVRVCPWGEPRTPRR